MNEAENTWRILQEKNLLVKSRWCSFNIHKWTQYDPPKSLKEGAYIRVYQSRYCDSCKLVNIKTLRTFIA